MSVIYKYIESDFDNMDFNKYCWHLKNKKAKKALKNYLKTAYSYTIYDGKPLAILSFHEYEPKKFDGCIIASKYFGNNPKYAVKMKFLIYQVIKLYKMKRVQTLSEDTETLNKWHEFIGFTKEKMLPKMIKNKNFILWGMTWE